MDLDYTYARLMAVLKGIAEGKGRGETVVVPPFGTSTTVFTALNDAAMHLHEPFPADDLDLVDQAFKKLGLTRMSDKKNEVALAMLTALVAPHPGDTPERPSK